MSRLASVSGPVLKINYSVTLTFFTNHICHYKILLVITLNNPKNLSNGISKCFHHCFFQFKRVDHDVSNPSLQNQCTYLHNQPSLTFTF